SYASQDLLRCEFTCTNYLPTEKVHPPLTGPCSHPLRCVQFGSSYNEAVVIRAADDQHAAISQQGGRMTRAKLSHTPCRFKRATSRTEQFGGGRESPSADQNPTILQGHPRKRSPRPVHGALGKEAADIRVVHFRLGNCPRVILASGDQHLPVGQHCGDKPPPWRNHVACHEKHTGGWVIQFGTEGGLACEPPSEKPSSVG